MLLVHKPSPNRIDIELSAPLDERMMIAGLDELIAQSQDVRDGVMMYRIPSFSIPTGRAVMVELERLPQLFGLIPKFKRCAVVTDTGWIQTVAELEGVFFPGLEIKGFSTAQEAEAEAWLAQAPGTDEDPDADFGDNMPV